MVNEIILGLIVLSLIGYIVWNEREHSKKESKYIKAILAKDLTEMVEAEMAEDTDPLDDTPPEFMPVEQLSDEAFAEHIKKNQ